MASFGEKNAVGVTIMSSKIRFQEVLSFSSVPDFCYHHRKSISRLAQLLKKWTGAIWKISNHLTDKVITSQSMDAWECLLRSG